MSSPKNGKTCSKCKKEKCLSDFYSKGEKIDSKCKSCAKDLRKKRYKKKKTFRNKTGRLMRINNVTYIEKYEADPRKRKVVCNTVNEILKDHIFKIVTGAYSKGNKDAA